MFPSLAKFFLHVDLTKTNADDMKRWVSSAMGEGQETEGKGEETLCACYEGNES